jgi:nucleotide-binding universal stress UspA family protein
MNVLRNAPVLVPACATAQGVNAAWRAALVARDLGVALRLLQLAPHLAPVSAQLLSLQRLALEIKAHLGIDVELTHATEHALAATVRAAREAALVVIGPRPGNPLRQLVLGTQAEQLIRLCRVPVLVVKRPATASYRRVLVPVELTPAARPVIATAARLSRSAGGGAARAGRRGRSRAARARPVTGAGAA